MKPSARFRGNSRGGEPEVSDGQAAPAVWYNVVVSEPDFLGKIKATIRRHDMLSSGDVVLVGVSGGPDSVALLHALRVLSSELSIGLCVGHLNHMLRGADADEDARYVRDLAARLGLPFRAESQDVARLASGRRISIEAAARSARYDFYGRAAEAIGASKIALGHHAADQAETVLMRLLRGAGTRALAGIPPVRPIRPGGPVVIRPLIGMTRREILRYCEENGLRPRTDASNLTSVYPRNKLRLELIPLLEQGYNPRVVETLARVADLLREDDDLISREATRRTARMIREESNERVVLDLAAMLSEHPAIQRRSIRLATESLGRPAENLEFHHVERVIELARRGAPGKSIDLPCGVRARRGYHELALEVPPSGGERPKAAFEHRLNVPGRTELPEAGMAIEAEVLDVSDREDLSSMVRQAGKDEAYLDMDAAGGGLVARSRRSGDRISPLGMAGSKKLKDLFIDEKIPGNLRDRMPVIASGGNVLWVVGVRVSERARITPRTRRALHLLARPLAAAPEDFAAPGVDCDRHDPVL